MDNTSSIDTSDRASLPTIPVQPASPPHLAPVPATPFQHEPSQTLVRMQQLFKDLTPSRHGLPLKPFLPPESERALAQVKEWETLFYLRFNLLDAPLREFKVDAMLKEEACKKEFNTLLDGSGSVCDEDVRSGLESIKSEVQYWGAEVQVYEEIEEEMHLQRSYWIGYRTRVLLLHQLPVLFTKYPGDPHNHYIPAVPTNLKLVSEMMERLSPQITRGPSATSSSSPSSKYGLWQNTY